MPILSLDELESYKPNNNAPSFRCPTVKLRLVPAHDPLLPTDNENGPGVPARAFVDTGADYSVVSRGTFNRLTGYCEENDLDELEPIGTHDPAAVYDYYPILLGFPVYNELELVESPRGVAVANWQTAALVMGWDILVGRDFLHQLSTIVCGEAVLGGRTNGTVNIWR